MQERARRRDAGMLQVTERDILALTWIAEQYCMSYDQLQRLLALLSPATPKRPEKVAPSTAQNAVERWLQLGYIDLPHKVIREHSTYVWLSRKGLRELALPYAYYQPKPSTVRHLYAVNTIRLHLQRAALSIEWNAQRAIRLHTKERPLPDAELRGRSSPLIALRVIEQPRLTMLMLQDELTTVKALASRYPRLWYFVPAQVQEPLLTAIRQHEGSGYVSQSSHGLLSDYIVWYSLEAQQIARQE
ncbi:hypothetical protein EPA93_32580 [Ktedonosporobacter rubrisoli]|uniref:Uncharacterized protein n=1 Tax=Ktedonosporobacter rubrisoli TaxID=2509675 RepID=A0A4P6JY69_KTERU|nr:replication-relaxation family protein [Ktedonosporobacter rubrisoli]QBD80455.1 hypothetical protein EPA93_32580 [Ktedonosporobacter rubrisoli]